MLKKPQPLKGQVAIVTGSTQGLGEAVARHLHALGLKGIVLCGRSMVKGKALERELMTESCHALFVSADLGDVEACQRVVQAADHQFGRIDILVNCAGNTERGTLLDTNEETFNRLFNINAKAPFFLMQEAARVMIREEIEGRIVNILSMSGHGGQPFICAYSGSKGALTTLTRNAAFSLLRNRIRVNGLNIGWMNTPGEDHIQRTFHQAEDGWLDKAVQTQPMGRLLEPKEVARAVAFLATEDSGMMSGAIIDLDQSVLGCYEESPQPSHTMSTAL